MITQNNVENLLTFLKSNSGQNCLIFSNNSIGIYVNKCRNREKTVCSFFVVYTKSPEIFHFLRRFFSLFKILFFLLK